MILKTVEKQENADRIVRFSRAVQHKTDYQGKSWKSIIWFEELLYPIV